MSATITITTTPVREIETDNRERSLWEILKCFPAPVWVVFGGMFINRFGTFVIPFLALHLKTLGYTTAQAGFGMACYGFGHFIATFVGGHLTDTLGRRKTIVLSMFSSAATMVSLAQAAELKSILFLASLAGFTGELYRPASSALLTDLVPEKDRVTAFAVYRFAINAGWAFGPATAGFLAKYSYSWLFYVDGITSLAYGIIAIHLLPRRENFTEFHTNSRPRDGFWKGLKIATNAAIGNKRFLQVVMASFAVALGFMQIFQPSGWK
ncbi:MAG TPA: MFS transporter [Verrucomicrobiales bacterium]|nr:MFS transporter [Verrucomicrobiales bacterium]